MPFEVGNTESKGRPKGSTNKIESSTKIFLRELMKKNTKKIEAELLKLEGKAYMDAIGSLMEFTEAKLARTEIQQDQSSEITISFKD